MKIERVKGQIKITPENQKEQRQLDTIEQEAKRLIPRLQELWQEDIIVISNVSELLELFYGKNVCFGEEGNITGSPRGSHHIFTRLTGTKGRPMEQRSLLVLLRLFTCQPYEAVLESEKQWRLKMYYREIRDKVVNAAVRRAKYKAIRDADMCVYSAMNLIEEFFILYPVFVIPYAILQTAVQKGLD